MIIYLDTTLVTIINHCLYYLHLNLFLSTSRMKSVIHSFPNFVADGPLLVSKCSHGSSYPWLHVQMIGIQNWIFISQKLF